MKPCRIDTCPLGASRSPHAHGMCVPHAFVWYFSREAALVGDDAAALRRYQQRQEAQDMLRGATRRTAQAG